MLELEIGPDKNCREPVPFLLSFGAGTYTVDCLVRGPSAAVILLQLLRQEVYAVYLLRVRRVVLRHLLQLGEAAGGRGPPAAVVLLLLLEGQVAALVPAGRAASAAGRPH